MSSVVAIVGRPNVGKSTLFNRLVGYKKAIVDDFAGVTRDRNYATVKLPGKTITLVDTGGFDADDQDTIMAYVRDQTLMAIEEADLTVFLTDGKEGINPHDRELLDILRRSGQPFIVAANKIDGPEKEHLLSDFYELGVEEVLPLSAAHGYGIRLFMEVLEEKLPPDEEVPEDEELIRVAVIGRPNVGKSSLVNRLVGDERSVVADQPGTTRDAVDVEFSHDGRRYLLVDTAGIRRKGRVSFKVEKFAVMQALRVLDRCHIALMLIDSTEGITDQDAHVAGYALDRGRGVILLFNKWDLVKEKGKAQKEIKDLLDFKMPYLSYAPYMTMSAKTGMRVDRIYQMINQVYDQYSFRAPTGQVNRVLEKAMEDHTPPYVGSRRLKYYYATQTGVRPPTFVVFTNRPDKVHFSYQRYLTNRFREAFSLDKSPVRVFFRPRHKDRKQKPA